ncbi:MAG: PhzF family isomerase [Proteocatella sp.]
MKKKYKIYQIDSFTKDLFTGNPAGVITNADGLSDTQMQQIARELNNSETAFIFSSNSDNYDIHVRFFTPTNEVPICGHATIAAHYARATEKKLKNSTVIQKTGAGILPVDILNIDNDYKIVMTQGEISVDNPFDIEIRNRIINALNISQEDLRDDCPITIASTGHSKVMIGIKDINILNNLSPNLPMLSEISKLISCNGYYVFTLHPEEKTLVHGRMFAPAIGINEDPVTGNANGPLGAYLIHFGLVSHNNASFSFEAVQGEAINRAGKIEVQVDIQENKPQKVRITGNAIIAFSTEIEI